MSGNYAAIVNMGIGCSGQRQELLRDSLSLWQRCTRMNYNSYNDFWMERMSWRAMENGTNTFTKEEIEWALRWVDDDHRFGDAELDDKQKMAVNILVWAAQKYLEGQIEIEDKYLCDC